MSPVQHYIYITYDLEVVDGKNMIMTHELDCRQGNSSFLKMKPWEPNSLTQWKGKFEVPKQTPFNDHYDVYLKNPKLNNLTNVAN